MRKCKDWPLDALLPGFSLGDTTGGSIDLISSRRLATNPYENLISLRFPLNTWELDAVNRRRKGATRNSSELEGEYGDLRRDHCSNATKGESCRGCTNISKA